MKLPKRPKLGIALLAWGAGVTVAELAIPLIQEVEESL